MKFQNNGIFQFDLFRPDTNLGTYFNNDNAFFTKINDPQRVFISWGLLKQDVSRCEKLDFECVGSTNFDDDFNMNSNETQLAIRVCT